MLGAEREVAVFDDRYEHPGLVLVVDDDESVLRSIDQLLASSGLRTILFRSAQQLLDADLPNDISCIVVDVRMPLMSGLDLQAALRARDDERPIIFLTGYADVTMTVRAMKAGAIDFLQKPYRDQDLLDAVADALHEGQRRRVVRDRKAHIQGRAALLTPREGQVLTLLADGLVTKQVAGELGLSEMTVKLHRTSVFRKMQARSVVELVRMVDVLEQNAR